MTKTIQYRTKAELGRPTEGHYSSLLTVTGIGQYWYLASKNSVQGLSDDLTPRSRCLCEPKPPFFSLNHYIYISIPSWNHQPLLIVVAIMSHLDPLVSPALSAASNMSSLFDLSNDTSSSRSDGSDDEIIYNFSEVPSLSANEFSRIAVSSDDDFVVLSRPRSQRSTPETEVFNHDEEALMGASGITDLVAGLADLAITPTSGRRRRCKGKAPQIPVSVAGTVAKKKKPKKKNKNKSQPSSVDAAASSSSSGSLPHSKRAASTTLVTEKRKVAKSEPSKVKKEKSNGLSGRPLVENLSDKFSDYCESDVGSPSMYEEAFAFITSYVDL